MIVQHSDNDNSDSSGSSINSNYESCLYFATKNGNLEMIKTLLNLDKKCENSFDCDKLINIQTNTLHVVYLVI